MAITLDSIKKSKNVAELLDDKQLSLIGQSAVQGYEIDESSREDWKKVVDKAMAIAKQVMEKKDFPWPDAANIKMPIITRACIDYAARTLPEIIKNEKIVKGVIVGKDEDGSKQRRCDRISRFMSYQLMEKYPEWENGTDSLLQTLPVVGTVFKKTYYSESEKRCVSEMCVPEDIVVNYNTQSLETARRITHILQMYTNDVLERQRRGVYLDSISVDDLKPAEYADSQDIDYPIEILEQHCYLDLDEDDYKEPYIVTVHKDSGKVLRIMPRFKYIEKKDGKILKIEPIQYFTDFHFIRSPDGGFYSMGFGSLLLPINTAINTLVNQLIDAGTLNNTQGGFLSRELRLKGGEFSFTMGEWKVLESVSGTKLSDNIYPLPTREPSQTLYQLLGLMLQEAKDLSSSTDALMGKEPTQNVASNVYMQQVEQGAKIFNAINKRVYRGFKKEYQKLYDLNYQYLSQKEYETVMDDKEANVKTDFEPDTCDVCPAADPELSSDKERSLRIQMIAQLPTVDRRAADELTIDALNISEAMKKKLLPPPDPNAPPPPEVQKMMAEIELIKANISSLAQKGAIDTAKVQLSQTKAQSEIQFMDAQVHESMARVSKMQHDDLHNKTKDEITAFKARAEAARKDAQFNHSANLDISKLQMQSDDTLSKRILEKSKLEADQSKAAVDALLKNKELDISAKNGESDDNN